MGDGIRNDGVSIKTFNKVIKALPNGWIIAPKQLYDLIGVMGDIEKYNANSHMKKDDWIVKGNKIRRL